MLPTYTTDRLILRSIKIEDLEDHLAMDLDPEVVKYIRPTPPPDEHRVFLKNRFAMQFAAGLGFWSVFEKGHQPGIGAFVGWALLVPLALEGPEVELGYRFVQRAWGKGYATQAARVIRDHGFEKTGLEEICAVTHPDNSASQHVLQKIGLTRQQNRFAYGQSLPYFTLTKSTWRSGQ